MKDIFGPEGYLDLELPEYEFRESQLDMARFIQERLADSENGIVEAGTGTGKTMAYLIPAINHALESGKRVAVSTETQPFRGSLQTRIFLWRRISSASTWALTLIFDMPRERKLPVPQKIRKISEARDFEKGDLEYLNRVSALFRERKIFTSHEADVPAYLWGEICRDSELCDQQRCPVSSICPFQAARREWAASDLLVMNHYLFFSNVASGKTYLPVTETVYSTRPTP
jgi:ATP-dependent DNA helicase DinG